MKPRIKLIRGIYQCYGWKYRSYIGCGFSVKEAFDDWKANAQL